MAASTMSEIISPDNTSQLQLSIIATSISNTASQTPFSIKLLDGFDFIHGKDDEYSTQDFVNGIVSERAGRGDKSDQSQRKYYHQCLRSLDWSFSEVIRDRNLLTILAAAIEDMEHSIKEAVALGIGNAENLRERIPLDTVPFKFAKKMQIKVQDMAKDDEIRVSFQALFLFILRPYLPIKYKSVDSFLERYPDFKDRSTSEQDRLRNSANWMDLAFYTMQPRNNKTFILNLIPRVVEGRNARYITGSGQTKPTSDRVNLFRWEGNCEKIKRPPRRKKDEVVLATTGKVSSSPEGPSQQNTSPLHKPNYPLSSSTQPYPHTLPDNLYFPSQSAQNNHNNNNNDQQPPPYAPVIFYLPTTELNRWNQAPPPGTATYDQHHQYQPREDTINSGYAHDGYAHVGREQRGGSTSSEDLSTKYDDYPLDHHTPHNQGGNNNYNSNYSNCSKASNNSSMTNEDHLPSVLALYATPHHPHYPPSSSSSDKNHQYYQQQQMYPPPPSWNRSSSGSSYVKIEDLFLVGNSNTTAVATDSFASPDNGMMTSGSGKGKRSLNVLLEEQDRSSNSNTHNTTGIGYTSANRGVSSSGNKKKTNKNNPSSSYLTLSSFPPPTTLLRDLSTSSANSGLDLLIAAAGSMEPIHR